MSRGAVFTTDSIIATSILMILLVGATYYIQESYTSRWNDVNMVRGAYDIGLALDEAGIISSGNDTLINDILNRTRQKNTAVSINVDRYRYIDGNLTLLEQSQYGDDITDNHMTQKVMSTDSDGDYYITLIRVGPR